VVGRNRSAPILDGCRIVLIGPIPTPKDEAPSLLPQRLTFMSFFGVVGLVLQDSLAAALVIQNVPGGLRGS
jgi:hypothetical protein